VLRFWESRFSQIRPMKRAGGRRYYRADDVDLLRGIRQLLYGEGYTIRGVQRILKEQGVKFVQAVWQEGAVQLPPPQDDDMAEEAQAPASEGAVGARGLRGLMPSLRGREMERREPQLGSPAEAAETDDDVEVTEPVLVAASATDHALNRDDLQRLQAVLHELGECRRLLDAVLR
jgi:DNA-binding transcriptional MerR regulator